MAEVSRPPEKVFMIELGSRQNFLVSRSKFSAERICFHLEPGDPDEFFFERM